MSTNQAPTNQLWVTASLIAMSIGISIVEGVAAARGAEVAESTEMLWHLVFSVLVTLWARYDASRSAVAREYSNLLMFFFWVVVLPYHLVRSRGAEGIVLFVGFLGLYLAPWCVALYVWAGKQ